ncbi:uncharacterized protein ASCRUDRAFT_76944 [Ascoidea rubescens DSM 1968]|uniref:Cyclin-D1-binding protein 1-like N-terminal domain-containing protein n=1 Tax=Ascoidea rubescens DSM 1968 TaxID=1344418 RepID=A0A1D2VDH4_9ASCO|nr:hypothetical protein ASCRUDRAFT_76944 [Ascoidea rubescens DSM 1968]ODV59560.1 hypothetical protein ASCRUDRAFT_76944 [Ascoidea rubescens DSM 1968]
MEELRRCIVLCQACLQTVLSSVEKKPLLFLDTPEPLVQALKLLRISTVKVAILFKLPFNQDDNLLPALKEITALSELANANVLPLVSQIYFEPHNYSHLALSRLFTAKILSGLFALFSSISRLMDEFLSILSLIDQHPQKNSQNQNLSNNRLISSANVLNNIDSLIKTLEDGETILFSLTLSSSLNMINDAIDDYDEWTQNPQQLDDPFGLQSNIHVDHKNLNQLVELSAKIYIPKVKLIKLLLSLSIKKLLSTPLFKQISDDLFFKINQLNLLIDDLVSSILMNNDILYIQNNPMKQIDSTIILLIDDLKKTYKDDPNKLKWFDNWLSKYSAL